MNASEIINEWIYKGDVTEHLDLSNLNLTKISDELPDTLQVLYCDDNLLTSLPHLPATLKYLSCSNNLLTSLPYLPSTLQTLYCSYNDFLFNLSVNNNYKNPNKHAWINYRILCKLQRNFHKRKRRRYYLWCKDIITNDISSLVVRYL